MAIVTPVNGSRSVAESSGSSGVSRTYWSRLSSCTYLGLTVTLGRPYGKHTCYTRSRLKRLSALGVLLWTTGKLEGKCKALAWTDRSDCAGSKWSRTRWNVNFVNGAKLAFCYRLEVNRKAVIHRAWDLWILMVFWFWTAAAVSRVSRERNANTLSQCDGMLSAQIWREMRIGEVDFQNFSWLVLDTSFWSGAKWSRVDAWESFSSNFGGIACLWWRRAFACLG